VLGLHVHGTGGDGIYISPTWHSGRSQCSNITVRDCLIERSYRNGITIISGENILVERCTVTETGGRAPQAGIHIEPESERDRLVNVLVRDSVVHDNEGSGFVVNITELTGQSEPMSVLVENCAASHSRHPSFRIMLGERGAPEGTIDFRQCRADTITYSGAWGVWHSSAPTRLRFTDCSWSAVARYASVAPLQFELIDSGSDNLAGGIEFLECRLIDDRDRDPFRLVTRAIEREVLNIVGHIDVVNASVPDTGPATAPNCPHLHLDYQP
jgi:hypothetical protein